MRASRCERGGGGALLALLLVACGTDGEIFEPVATGPCPVPGTVGRVAEWHANGDLRNDGTCASWQAQIQGTVPYGDGRGGQAWHFRSDASPPIDDPDYIEVRGAAGAVMPEVTVDVLARQTGFNAYVGSDRFLVTTRTGSFGDFTPGEWALYVHESRQVFFFVKVGAAYVRNVDWQTCFFGAAPIPLGEWVRYTATYDGATIRCYRDGRFMNSTSLSAAASGAINGLVIGRNYPGDIDAVRIFNRALDTADVAPPWP